MEGQRFRAEGIEGEGTEVALTEFAEGTEVALSLQNQFC